MILCLLLLFVQVLIYVRLFLAVFHFLSYLNDLKMENLADDNNNDDSQHQGNSCAKSLSTYDILIGVTKTIYLLACPSEYFRGYKLNSDTFPDLNTLFTIVCYFRIIFIYCYLSKITRYYGTRISRLLSVYGHRSKATNIVYTIKCLFK